MKNAAMIAGGLLVLGVALGACVADDPVVTPTPAGDGGVTPPATSADGGGPGPASSDGAPGTCAGKTFGTPQAITVSDVGENGDMISSLRLVGENAYYAKAIGPAPSTPKLFRGTFTRPVGDVGPKLTGNKPIVSTSATEADRSPSVAPDGSFIVFTHGPNDARKIWTAVANGSLAFDNPGSSELVGFNGDDADPWVAGNPPRALYWGRAPVGGGLRRITRTVLAPQSSLAPKLEESPTPVSSPCPDGFQCGAPVVTATETMMLFFKAQIGLFVPLIQEVKLTPSATSNAVTSDNASVVDHPELGSAIPSWISDDGCDVIVGLNTTAELRWAHRTPQ